MSKNQPIEVSARHQIAQAAASLISFERAASTSIQEQRAEAWSGVLNLIKTAGRMPDEDINAVCAEFGVTLAKAGFKKESIYTKKSELRRMLENEEKIPDGCTGWKAALRAIKEFDTPALELLREDVQASLDAINNHNEAINKAVAGYADMNGLSVEDALTALQNAMVAHEAAKQADVGPVNNVAEVLRGFKPGAAMMAAPAQAVTKAKAAAPKVAAIH